MNKTPFYLFLGLSLIFPGQIVRAQELHELTPDKLVEGRIAGGEAQIYQIRLAAGQFLRVVAEQKEIDLTLTLASPDNKQTIEMNLTGTGGLESLSEEAATNGDYRLTIRGNGSAATGAYYLKTETRATVSPQNKQRIVGERLLIEASELRKQGGKTGEQTIKKLESAISVWNELQDQYWSAWTLFNIGAANSNLSRHEKAIEYYEKALAIYRNIKDRSGEGIALNSLGIAYFSLSRYEKALEFYEWALKIALETKNRSEEGNTSVNLGSVYYSLSRYEKAIEYREQALAIYKEVKNRSGEASALNGLGSAYFSLSRYEKALEYYEQALAINREIKNRIGEGNVSYNLGRIYNSLSRYEKAIEYLGQALTIYREIKQRANEGLALNVLGNSSLGLNRYEKAIEYYEQALAINREIKNRFGEGNALNNLGIAYVGLKNNEKAIVYLEQALAIYGEVKNRAGEASALNSSGDANYGLSRYEKAVGYYERALLINRDVGNRRREAEMHYNLARTNLAQNNFVAAHTNIEESLKVAESIRADLVSSESRASLIADVQNSYRLYVDVLMRQQKAEPTKGFNALAIEVSERQRARSLLDLLAESKIDLRQDGDPALIEREQTLAKQLNDKAQTLTKTDGPEKISALKLEISQLENDLERAQTALRKASPHYAALTQPQPLKLKEIQAQLDANTILLEYSLGTDRSYLWAITKDSLTGYELPQESEIKEKTLAVYEILTARNNKIKNETVLQRSQRIFAAEAKLPAAAKILSDTILSPAAAQFGNKRLVIVADGALQYIPFAMLPDPASGKDKTANANLQPLVVNHEIVSLPSASALAIQRTELANRQLAPKTLAVVADPVFDKTDARFKTAMIEASFKPSAQPVASADERGLEYIADANSNGKLVIRRLLFTEREATGLLALAPKTSSFGATGFQANRKMVMSGELANYRYVHFATHGLLDTERPGLSSLVLSMVDAKGKAENGFLRANDIYNMKLPAELVVLSACQTGLGKEVKGEGLVGLTRGFMYAGAKRVAVSLWSVNDKATAVLMEKFYRGMLKQNERPAAALRAAQIEMWKQKAWQSPYYWSAFIIQGDWR